MKEFFESIKRFFCRKKAVKKETVDIYYSSESMSGARVTPYVDTKAKDLPNVALAEQWRRIYAKMN